VTAATLSGRVFYRGPHPPRRALDLSGDPACAEHAPAETLVEDLVVDPSGGLANAVVFLEDGLPQGRYPVPPGRPSIDQRGCVYRPRVVAVMVGQELEFLNSDPTTHNIHPAPRENRAWNRSQVAEAIPIRDTFDREEIAIPIRCNVHPWMQAWVAVIGHPFFAVTGEDGSYRIQGVPPGEYGIGVWHEKLGRRSARTRLAPQEEVTLELDFPAGDGA
jgi:hypothetical protein